jgi:uncharacterized protein YciI
MAYFFVKLIPPRPSFPSDMTESEAALMRLHGHYWQNLLDQGDVIAFGPVFDSAGPWGLGLIKADEEGAARALAESDPVIRTGCGFSFQLFPTHLHVAPGSRP